MDIKKIMPSHQMDASQGQNGERKKQVGKYNMKPCKTK